MIPKECKRLIEVDFPIAEVSRHSAREKCIRHGHPCTLHLWWARRPLAACRAVLMGLLLPDPCDEHCPPEFKDAARKTLRPLQGVARDDADLREALLDFIADFANWDNASHPAYLQASRALVKAAHPEETPLVVDPFAGGGSIPLEALRVGCDAFASDLNPVACLILKVMLEDIPRYGNAEFTLKDESGKEVTVRGLADALRHVGKQVKKAAEKELAPFYPPDPDGARPIAYLWARTVRCEAPGCGAEIPLVRSFWLCRKTRRKWALRYTVKRRPGKPPHLDLELFQPESAEEVPPRTVRGAKATCICCGATLPPDRVRAQLVAQNGGAETAFDDKGQRTGGARMLAVVTLRPSERGRQYRVPAERDYASVLAAQEALARLPKGAVPEEPIPKTELRRLAVPLYGMTSWTDLFTARQKLMLATLAGIARSLRRPELLRGIAICVDRMADGCCSLSNWLPSREEVKHVFARQALPMVWDFAEVSFLSQATRSWDGAVNLVAKVLGSGSSSIRKPGQVQAADAARSPIPDQAGGVWFTDPPYYDSVPYAHLSDFFYVWLRRCLQEGRTSSSWFADMLSPKEAECVVDRPHSSAVSTKTAAYFESKLGDAMREGRRTTCDEGVACVVFAHKTTEGWEALLGGLIKAGWVISASWPIETEMSNKVSGKQGGEQKAMLLASIHLVCRPRAEAAGVGGWEDILRQLPVRIVEWVDRLSAEGIRGADLVFACIGPGLELFSRYERVETPDGEEVGLGPNAKAKGEPARRGFLSYIWEMVGRTALRQVLGTAEATAYNDAVGALEEDARLTALFLWTLQATEQSRKKGSDDDEEEGGRARPAFSLIYDVARRFAQPLGIHLEDWEGRIIKTQKGVVHLIPVAERAKQLFGEESAATVGRRFEEATKRDRQLKFDFMEDLERGAVPEIRGRRKRRKGAEVSEEDLRASREATTLDRVHAAMLLQAGGQTHALRALLEAETGRGPDFLRLANALSALYPTGSEEKRLLDAMLLAVPRR